MKLSQKILSFIKTGESQEIEFKSQWPRNERLTKERVVFATSNKGTILVAVKLDER